MGSRTWAFDWHQGWWPWMTLNSISLNFHTISRDFATTAKRMKIMTSIVSDNVVSTSKYLLCFRVARVCQRQLGFLVKLMKWSIDTHSSRYSTWVFFLETVVAEEHNSNVWNRAQSSSHVTSVQTTNTFWIVRFPQYISQILVAMTAM